MRHPRTRPQAGTALAVGSAITALLVLSVPPASVEAQTPGREPAVVELPAGTRAMGLGGAYPLGHPDADVLFANPSLLERAGGSLLGSVHRSGDDALGFSVAGAREWFGGGVGLGLRVLEYASPGPGARGGGPDGLFGSDGPGVTEMAASVGVSREVVGVRVGVAASVVAQRWPDFRQASASFDVGLSHDVGPVTAGLAVRNLGPDRAIRPEADVPQPTAVTLGLAGYGKPVGPLDLGVAADVSRRDDGEWVAGGGLELGYWPVLRRTFVARIGARTVPEGEASPLTLGASYWGDDLVLNYAWRSAGDAGSVHRFGVGWR